MVTRHFRENLLVQFSLASFVIMFGLAVATSTILAARLGRNIELLIAHGAAMDAMAEHSMSGDTMVESAEMERTMSADSLMDGFIKDTDPFSIPSLTADVQNLRWNMYLVITGGFLVLYLGLVSIVHRGWRTITRQAAGLLKSQVQLKTRAEERSYEIGKANKALMEEISVRMRVEQLIQASLKEKELLLKEINHRVKNNLQLISSLLQHQSNFIADEQALQVFRDSKDRIRSMALVHEKLYQSKDLAKISFADYVRSLTSSLTRSYGASSEAIQLKIYAQEVFLGVDTAIPCALIINELVSNSIVHAFPGDRDGEIRIDIRSEDDHCELMVSDNGIGFPKDLDLRTSETMGLELVCTLVDQLEGTIELGRGTSADGAGASSAPGERSGTSFRIAFTDLELSNASE